MNGPVDRDVAELLQAPLSYPGLDDQEEDVMAAGVAQARQGRRPTRPPATPPARPPARRTPPPARTLTPEQKVTKETLRWGVGIVPDQEKIPFGTSVDVSVVAKWVDDQGTEVPWDPSRIHVRFFRTTRDGPGPHRFEPEFTPKSIVVTVDLWNERAKEWRAVTLRTRTVTAYCPVDVPSLAVEPREVVATLFAEGGATPTMTRDELIRTAWCMRRRVELVAKMDADLARDPDNRVLKRRVEKMRTYFAKRATYVAVLSHPLQFSGYGTSDPRYVIAKDPKDRIKTADDCRRLNLTKEVALGVMDGSIADPYEGMGNPTAPGCLYYMTKARWEKHKTWNAENPDKKPKFQPTWDRLPGKLGDIHFYWGMKLEDPFVP